MGFEYIALIHYSKVPRTKGQPFFFNFIKVLAIQKHLALGHLILYS